MPRQKIPPAKSLSGELSLPGDKSISHRYAILAALAGGPSRIHNFSSAADCSSTLSCLSRLGIPVDRKPEHVTITGSGLRGLTAPRRTLDAQNSGATLRLLTGLLAGQSFPSRLTGDKSLRSRPMRRILEPLASMGARIASADGGLAPLDITGAPLRGIDYTLPVASAQVKSCLLLAGLFAEGPTSVSEPVATRDHLELALAEFGLPLERDALTWRLTPSPNTTLEPRDLTVPGDLSSAVFFLAAALILPGSQLTVRGVGLNPTRSAVLDFLATMGAPIALDNVQLRHAELVGDIHIAHAPLTGGTLSGHDAARMIDELPMLAALGPFTRDGIEIRDAAELRVKESDRIAALAANLRALGAEVEELPDGLRVAPLPPGRRLRAANIDPRRDHRIAMACSIAALAADAPSSLTDPSCVSVSFPEFFPLLARLSPR